MENEPALCPSLVALYSLTTAGLLTAADVKSDLCQDFLAVCLVSEEHELVIRYSNPETGK